MRPRLLWNVWSPPRLMVSAFATAILVGTLLLRLPAASSAAPLGWIDALFTSTSAVCVTGLVVVDTGTRLSSFGQGVVLLLIQAGGLGIMTFSTLGAVLLGRRLALPGRFLLYSRLGPLGQGELYPLLKRLLVMVGCFELAGAVVLSLAWPADGWAEKAWNGLFHSVSAFCNAGFGLLSDSLVTFRGDWVVAGTVLILVVCGGLGFPVLLELHARLTRQPVAERKRLTVHSRVALLVTGFLIVVGVALIYLFERNHALASLGAGEGWLATAFQAITPRTAGFNTLPIGELQPTTLFLLILLMIIGGSPGSTAGGIKTTSVGVLAAFVWARGRGREAVHLFRRTLPLRDVRKAATVASSAILILFVAVLALLLTEAAWGIGTVGAGAVTDVPRGRTGHGFFLEIFFETTSALGTVGLSTGVTPSLSAAGRLIIILVMFLGRLGPLTIAMAMATTDAEPSYRYPEEQMMIG